MNALVPVPVSRYYQSHLSSKLQEIADAAFGLVVESSIAATG